MKWCAVFLLGCSQTVGLEAPDIADPPQVDFASAVDFGAYDLTASDLGQAPDLRQPADMIVCGVYDMGPTGWLCGCGLGGLPCCASCSGCNAGGCATWNSACVAGQCKACGGHGDPCCVDAAGNHTCVSGLACTTMTGGGDVCQ